MKAIVQCALGEPIDVLKMVHIPDNVALGPSEVLVDVSLAPVHHGDLALIRSQPNIPAGKSHVRRGSEAVGIVRAVGSDVEDRSRVAVGDRVIAFPAAGSWAQNVVVPASATVPVPSELSDEVAAQLLINFVTARMVLRSLRKSVPDEALRDGALLVTGAGTVVARLLLHLLGELGFTPIGLARTAASAQRIAAQMNGVSVTATGQPDWRAQVTSLASGRKVVGVLDCVSGPLLADLAPLLVDDAVIVTYGALGGGRFGVGAQEVVGRQFVIRGVVFTRWFSDLTPNEQAEDIRLAFQVASAVPSLFKTSGVYDLADIGDAVVAVEAPGRDGFVFIRP